MNLATFLTTMPLIAVLRYITPEEVLDIAQALIASHITCLEVPMNSPRACESIARLAAAYGTQAWIGAGTVTQVDDVKRIADAGGTLIVMPHTDTRIIEAAKKANLCCIPGFMTPSEAYRALDAGADALKLFPAEQNPPATLKAMRAILPKSIAVIPTGGITPEKMLSYVTAGANGFGLGSALYQPGDCAQTVGQKAAPFVNAMRAALKSL